MQRWCRECANEHQRHHRKKYHELSEEARAKHRVRLTAQNAVRDGKLEQQPCRVCGTTVDVERHHADYSRPLEVDYLCGKHHREHEGRG